MRRWWLRDLLCVPTAVCLLHPIAVRAQQYYNMYGTILVLWARGVRVGAGDRGTSMLGMFCVHVSRLRVKLPCAGQ